MHKMAMRLKHLAASLLANGRPRGGTQAFGQQAIDDLSRTGLFTVEGFLDRPICNQMIEQFWGIAARQPDRLIAESNGTDTRIYGADRLSDIFKLHSETAALDAMARSFYRSRTVEMFQMAGHIRFSPDNLGSGSGWHRDSPFSQQLKFMIYLNDVSAENGPFEYLPGSHRGSTLSRINQYLDIPSSDYRFSEEQIAALEQANIVPPRKTVSARAGTLVVFNAKGLHRGRPLLSGERWAVTRYYYKHIPKEMFLLLPPK